ncbi:MAG TPA: hypothetical protein VJ160_04280 [Anaerolineales bacterium]|nr:hypothetical protein [Anaerolineales bacterium]
MDLVVECGDCGDFVGIVQRYLGDLLKQHGFHSLHCEADRGGRECWWMLESDRCRLLFTLMDGAQDCSMGRLDTPFPGKVSLLLNGEGGWYNTRFLIELKTGQELLNRKLVNEFIEGKRAYFEWLSPLLEKWLAELVPLFEGNEEPVWHDDFARMLEERKPW